MRTILVILQKHISTVAKTTSSPFVSLRIVEQRKYSSTSENCHTEGEDRSKERNTFLKDSNFQVDSEENEGLLMV